MFTKMRGEIKQISNKKNQFEKILKVIENYYENQR